MAKNDKNGSVENDARDDETEVQRQMRLDAEKAASGDDPQAAKNAEARAMQERIDDQARLLKNEEAMESARIQARLIAERAEQEKLRPLPPITQSVSATFARPGEKTVDMVFARPMFIWAEPTENQKNRHKVSFSAGIQPVPESLVDNWYLRSAGVKTLDEVREEDRRRREPVKKESGE